MVADTIQKPTSGLHAQVAGSPGVRPRLAGLMRTVWPMFVVVAVAGYLLRAACPYPWLPSEMVGFLFLLLAVALAAAVNVSASRLTSFLKGAQGEERVARELAFLPASYHVFHGLSLTRGAVMPRGGDYDHVVVGPTGVFLIETKNWSGRVSVEEGRILYDGQQPSRSPVDQVKRASSGLRRHLRRSISADVEVVPVVCLAADTLAQDVQGVAGILACNVRVLNRAIRETHDTPLDSDLRDRIARALEPLLE